MPTLLRRSAVDFFTLSDKVSDLLTVQFRHHTGHSPSPAEVRSWDASSQVVAGDLVDAGLGNIEVLAEYGLPFSSKRADLVLAGIGRRTGRPHYVVVELKQWTQAFRFEDSDDLVVVPSYGPKPVTHPVTQVRDYCDYLLGYTAALAEHPQSVEGAVYFHNSNDDGLAPIMGVKQDRLGRIFTSQRRAEFVDYLSRTFEPSSGAEAADQLLSSAIRPSKQLHGCSRHGVSRAVLVRQISLVWTDRRFCLLVM